MITRMTPMATPQRTNFGTAWNKKGETLGAFEEITELIALHTNIEAHNYRFQETPNMPLVFKPNSPDKPTLEIVPMEINGLKRMIQINKAHDTISINSYPDENEAQKTFFDGVIDSLMELVPINKK